MNFSQQKNGFSAKKIGLIGGMSWESTALYYKFINEGVARQLGGFHSCPIVLNSMDFAPFEQLSHAGDWQAIAKLLITMAMDLERAGVEGIALCSNTAHRVADEVSQAIQVPLLHIGDATGRVIKSKGLKKVALLGTRFTMEEMFYREHLEQSFGCNVQIPEEEHRELVHRIIYDELCKGVVTESSRQTYLEICEKLINSGSQGVILGCTEVGMLVKQSDLKVPVMDTARVHCDAILDFTLS